MVCVRSFSLGQENEIGGGRDGKVSIVNKGGIMFGVETSLKELY
jgi:hypothetical protein